VGLVEGKEGNPPIGPVFKGNFGTKEFFSAPSGAFLL